MFFSVVFSMCWLKCRFCVVLLMMVVMVLRLLCFCWCIIFSSSCVDVVLIIVVSLCFILVMCVVLVRLCVGVCVNRCLMCFGGRKCIVSVCSFVIFMFFMLVVFGVWLQCVLVSQVIIVIFIVRLSIIVWLSWFYLFSLSRWFGVSQFCFSGLVSSYVGVFGSIIGSRMQNYISVFVVSLVVIVCGFSCGWYIVISSVGVSLVRVENEIVLMLVSVLLCVSMWLQFYVSKIMMRIVMCCWLIILLCRLLCLLCFQFVCMCSGVMKWFIIIRFSVSVVIIIMLVVVFRLLRNVISVRL